MSSSSDSYQEPFSLNESGQESSSPFLSEEYLVEEAGTAPSWRLPAPSFQLESPFVGAFEKEWEAIDELENREPFDNFTEVENFSRKSQDFSPTAEWMVFSEAEYQPHQLIDEFQQSEYFRSEAFDERGSLEAGMPEVDREALYEFDVPPTQAITDALRNKDWKLALKLAIQEGWRDENQLTNLLFFARHPELMQGKLDSKDPKYKQLSREWAEIRNKEVWEAIQASAANPDLAVSGKEVADHHRFFWGKSGKRLKQLVENAAREVGLNPGLLGTIMMAETRRPQSYLSSRKVSSYHIGTDDFYEGRFAIKARVPAYAKVKWDKKQKPEVHFNDAKTKPRQVKTILFDSGSAAVLATAVYAKFYEVRLREIAASLNGNFDQLPLPTQFALTRMAMAAGAAGATPFLKAALKGEDIFVRRAIPVRAYQTQRNATVRTAQAIHLSDWIFGIPISSPTVQPELETFENFDQESFDFYGFETELDGSEIRNKNFDREFSFAEMPETFAQNFLQDETFNSEAWESDDHPEDEIEENEIEKFAEFENELLLEFDELEIDELETDKLETHNLILESETSKGLSKKLKFLSLLPHTIEKNGKETALTPAVMDSGIYDGSTKYKIAPNLQACLMTVMNKRKFSHIKVALVDLTKDVNKPEFAAFNHKSQVFAASVPKIAAKLGAFQLRQDLRAALKQKGSKTLNELYEQVRDDWAATQLDPKGKAKPLTLGISLRGKLVLVQGEKIALREPKAPLLENVFAETKAGSPVTIEFKSTGETKAQLNTLIEDFNKRKRGAKQKLDALGFLERMRIMVGGLVPASNYATSTIVRDVGFLYIASTLLQSGLYDTDRGGGLWLGADYWGGKWRGAPGGGSAQSATAGSLAAFMTLLGQDRLVSPQASTEMRSLLKKEPNLTHPGIVSWFKEGLKELKDGGSLKQIFSKLGAHSGVDDCTLIEREVDLGGGKKLLRYVAVGLRARSAEELKSLILELDRCILSNNGLTPAQGGHS